jgi:hypothetical protein
MSENSNQPHAKKQSDCVQCAIWQNTFPNGDVSYTVTFTRNSKDREGKWQRRHDFRMRDLPHLILVTNWAIEQLMAFNETADNGGD